MKLWLFLFLLPPARVTQYDAPFLSDAVEKFVRACVCF